jgi:hypothetical protein
MIAGNRPDASAKPRGVAFYCVVDERYFLGAVGMINSLRLVGHDEPVYVLDCGLDAEQRELLAPHAAPLPVAGDIPPWLLKAVAPLRHPHEVMVLIDADVIVTRHLGDLIAHAAAGRVVAFENNIDRFVPEWGELLDLGPIRRHPYLCSALVAIPRSPGEEILELMQSRQSGVDFERAFWRQNDPDYPFLYGDQDVLNAILATRLSPETVVSLDHRLAAATPFVDLDVLDEASLHCVYPDGTEPYVLHHILPAKPWLRPMHDGTYSRLLKRLLVGPDLALRVPTAMVPLRMRTGALAYVERKRVDAAVKLRWHVGIALHRIWTRLAALPRRWAPRRP